MQYTLSALLLLSPLFTAAHKLVPGSPVETVNTEPAGGKDSDLLTFPGDWSRNVLPIPVHSHNDYWRDVRECPPVGPAQLDGPSD